MVRASGYVRTFPQAKPRRRLSLRLLGYVGLVLALVAYALQSDPLFVVAGVVLGTDAYRRRAWPFVLLNLIWSGIALARIFG